MALFGKKTEEEKQEEKKADVIQESHQPAVLTDKMVNDILVQPRVSEKAGHLSSQNKYIFKVKTSANKIEVKKAVEQQYHVTVLRVNMIRNEGKKRVYGRTSGRMSDFKKAIVTLKQGDKIDIALETV